MHQQTIKTLA